MAHGDEIIAAHEDMRFAERDLAADDLRRVRDEEQRIGVDVDLRALVRAVRILDRELVQVEFLAQLFEQRLVRLVQADPDERVRHS